MKHSPIPTEFLVDHGLIAGPLLTNVIVYLGKPGQKVHLSTGVEGLCRCGRHEHDAAPQTLPFHEVMDRWCGLCRLPGQFSRELGTWLNLVATLHLHHVALEALGKRLAGGNVDDALPELLQAHECVEWSIRKMETSLCRTTWRDPWNAAAMKLRGRCCDLIGEYV
jgi:hypothetical protein